MTGVCFCSWYDRLAWEEDSYYYCLTGPIVSIHPSKSRQSHTVPVRSHQAMPLLQPCWWFFHHAWIQNQSPPRLRRTVDEISASTKPSLLLHHPPHRPSFISSIFTFTAPLTYTLCALIFSWKTPMTMLKHFSSTGPFYSKFSVSHFLTTFSIPSLLFFFKRLLLVREIILFCCWLAYVYCLPLIANTTVSKVMSVGSPLYL